MIWVFKIDYSTLCPLIAHTFNRPLTLSGTAAIRGVHADGGPYQGAGVEIDVGMEGGGVGELWSTSADLRRWLRRLEGDLQWATWAYHQR